MNLWAFRFTLCYLCIMLVQPQNRFTFLYPFKIADISFISAVILHAASSMQSGNLPLRLSKATIATILFLLATLYSHYFGALQTSTQWNSTADVVLKAAALMIILEATCTTIPRVWAILVILMTATLWWVKAGVRLSASGATYSGDRVMGAAVGMVENPNGMAYMMCVMLPVYLFFFESAKHKIVRYAFLGLCLVTLYIIFQTGSRTGLMCLIALGGGLIFRYGRNNIPAIIIVAVSTFVIIGMVSPGNLERFKSIPNSIREFMSGEEKPISALTQDEQSAQERRLKNRDSWRLIQEYPLGVGTAADQGVIASKHKYGTGQVHNEFLRVGVVSGYPGLLLYIYMFYIMLRNNRAVKKKYKKSWPVVYNMASTLQLMVIPLIVGGYFSPGYYHAIFVVCLAASSALYEISKRQPA